MNAGMAVAILYDALISVRPYNPAFPHAWAMEIVCDGDGRTLPQPFDPVVPAAFKTQEKELRRIAREFADEGEG